AQGGLPAALVTPIIGKDSSFKIEGVALATVDIVLEVLHRLTGHSWQPPQYETPAVDYVRGERLLHEHADVLLGPPSPGRVVLIMVTMPGEGADDYTLVYNLLGPQFVAHASDSQEVGRAGRVLLDLLPQ